LRRYPLPLVVRGGGNLFQLFTKSTPSASQFVPLAFLNPGDASGDNNSCLIGLCVCVCVCGIQGMAVLRLLRGFVGWRGFRQGLKVYLGLYRLHRLISMTSGGSGTFSLGGSGSHGFGLRAFNRNNYRSPTTNYTMEFCGSDA